MLRIVLHFSEYPFNVLEEAVLQWSRESARTSGATNTVW